MVCAFAIVMIAMSAFAQETKPDQKNILELPEFVITGAGSLGIQSVHKLDVTDTWGLDSATRALLRPVVGNVRTPYAPDSVTIVRPLSMMPLVAHGQFGMYRTPSGWLHYSGASDAFDWRLHVSGGATQGSSDNATASIVSVDGGAGWRVPDNVMYFADSRVGIDAAITSLTYNLYGSTAPAQSRVLGTKHIEIGVNQDGGSLPFSFFVVRGSASANDSLEKIDTYFGFGGSVAIVAPHWTVRGDVNIRSYAAPVSQRNFSMLNFDAAYTVAPFRYAIGAGLFTAQNTMFDQSMELAPHASAALLLGGAEIFTTVARRVRDESIMTLTTTNPFVSLGALDSIRFPVDQLDARIGVRTTDVRMLAAEMHLAYIRTTSAPVFMPMENGRWSVDYVGTKTIELAAEARWRALLHTAVIATGTLRSALLEDGSPVPYVSVADGLVSIEQTFDFPLVLSTSVSVIGRRTGWPAGTASPAYALWNVDGSYALNTHLSVTAMVHNVLNTAYEMWPGYPAMKILAAVGMTAKF